MSSHEMLTDAITQASKELAALEENYWNLPPAEREGAIWAEDLLEKIENMRDSIDHMNKAIELLPEA